MPQPTFAPIFRSFLYYSVFHFIFSWQRDTPHDLLDYLVLIKCWIWAFYYLLNYIFMFHDEYKFKTNKRTNTQNTKLRLIAAISRGFVIENGNFFDGFFCCHKCLCFGGSFYWSGKFDDLRCFDKEPLKWNVVWVHKGDDKLLGWRFSSNSCTYRGGVLKVFDLSRTRGY